MRTTTPIGAFAACYIGLSGQSTVLTQLNSTRTDGAEITEDLPTDYVVSIDSPIQVGNHICRATLNFLSTSDEVTRLVRGLVPTETNMNAPVGQTLYALLVVVGNGSDNYYFPKVRTEKSYKRQYSKKVPTTTGINFTAENRDVTVPLMYKGTLSELQAIMGTQYPL